MYLYSISNMLQVYLYINVSIINIKYNNIYVREWLNKIYISIFLPYIHRSLNILHTKYLLLLSILMIVKRPSRLGLHLYCLHLRFISTSWKQGGAEYDEYCCLERILSTLSHNDSTYSIISLDILYSIVLCVLYMY